MMKKLLAVLATAMLLCFAAAGAAETAAKQEFDFGGLGTVELTTIADYSDDMGLVIDDSIKPEGKLVVVVLTLTNGSEMNFADAVKGARENVRLDDFPVFQIAGNGATINAGAGTITLTGFLGVFFDVPEDYDLGSGVITIYGAEAVNPLAAPAAE